MDIKILAENMRRFNTKNLQEQSDEQAAPTKVSALQNIKNAAVETGTDLLNKYQAIFSKIKGFTFNLYSVSPGNLETNGNNPMITGFTITNIQFKGGYATFRLVLNNPDTTTNSKLNASLVWDSKKPDQFTITGKQNLGFASNPAVVYNEKFSAALMTEFNKLRNNPKADFAQNNTGAPTNNIA